MEFPDQITRDYLESFILNILFIMSIICTLYIILSNNLINLIIYLSSLSLILCLIYLLLNAPDVSITEASIGACISTIISIIAVINVECYKSNDKFSIMSFILVTIFGFMIYICLDDLPIYGDINSSVNNEIYKYYIENSGSEIGSNSIAASILADYRGYDTLAETSVVLIAGLSIIVLLRERRREN